MSTFVIVMGVALLLTGIGFLVLTVAPLREAATTRARKATATAPRSAAQV